MVLSSTTVIANSTCKVEGSSNNNIAMLDETYVKGGHGEANLCGVSFSVSLTKQALGETTIVVEIFDDYKHSVATTTLTIDKGQKSGHKKWVKLNKIDNDCGYYSLSIISAFCKESRTINKPIATSNQEYVDLDLPSGTMWKNSNEKDRYSFYEASLMFDESLPSKEQWQELLNYCTWEWTGNEDCGVLITARNGNSIFLPVRREKTIIEGMSVEYCSLRGDYASATLYENDVKKCYELYFYEDQEAKIIVEDAMNIYDEPRYTFSVRLVKANPSKPAIFVDLGLPSGTKWKSINETEFMTYKEAITKYPNAIPTNEQWQELMDLCKWTRLGGKFCVTGPNGNSIIIKVMGSKWNVEQLLTDIGIISDYCTIDNKSLVILNLEDVWLNSAETERNDVLRSVHLVENKR